VLHVDVDECAEGMSTCDLSSTECVNVVGGYFCQCRPGFRPTDTRSELLMAGDAPSRRCVDVDECSGWGGGHRCPAGTVCRNTLASYDCVCDNDDDSCHQLTSMYSLKSGTYML